MQEALAALTLRLQNAEAKTDELKGQYVRGIEPTTVKRLVGVERSSMVWLVAQMLVC